MTLLAALSALLITAPLTAPYSMARRRNRREDCFKLTLLCRMTYCARFLTALSPVRRDEQSHNRGRPFWFVGH